MSPILLPVGEQLQTLGNCSKTGYWLFMLKTNIRNTPLLNQIKFWFRL